MNPVRRKIRLKRRSQPIGYNPRQQELVAKFKKANKVHQQSRTRFLLKHKLDSESESGKNKPKVSFRELENLSTNRMFMGKYFKNGDMKISCSDLHR